MSNYALWQILVTSRLWDSEIYQWTTTTPEGNIIYIDLIFSMVAKTVTKEKYSESEWRKALSMYIGIMNNWIKFVDTHLSMMKNIMLANLGQHVSATIILTWITTFQVLVSVLFYNPHLELAEQDNMGVAQQVFGQWTKDCENREVCIPQKLIVLGLTSILLLPNSALPESISLAETQLIYSMVTIIAYEGI